MKVPSQNRIRTVESLMPGDCGWVIIDDFYIYPDYEIRVVKRAKVFSIKSVIDSGAYLLVSRTESKALHLDLGSHELAPNCGYAINVDRDSLEDFVSITSSKHKERDT